MKIIAIVALALMGCATATPKSPLIYEDANVAIYKVCGDLGNNWGCRQEVIQKKHSADINADVSVSTRTIPRQ